MIGSRERLVAGGDRPAVYAAGPIQASWQGLPNCQGGKTRGPEASDIKALEIVLYASIHDDGRVDGLVARTSVRTSPADVTGLTRRCTSTRRSRSARCLHGRRRISRTRSIDTTLHTHSTPKTKPPARRPPRTPPAPPCDSRPGPRAPGTRTPRVLPSTRSSRRRLPHPQARSYAAL